MKNKMKFFYIILSIAIMFSLIVLKKPQEKITYYTNEEYYKLVKQDGKRLYTDDILRLTNSNKLHKEGILGKGISIAFLDTGVYPHKEIIFPTNKILKFKDFVNGYEEPYDDNGHGTFLAGLIVDSRNKEIKHKGIAPKANIVAIKVLNEYGEGDLNNILNGVYWVIDNKIQYNIKVINMSFNIKLNTKSSIHKFQNAITMAKDAGLVIVTSVGNKYINSSKNSVTYPSCFSNVITVGALDYIPNSNYKTIIPNIKVAPYSVIHKKDKKIIKPDILAPGTNIISLNTDYLYLPGKEKRVNAGYRTDSGSSIACAVVSGIAALTIEKNNNKSVKEIERLILQSTYMNSEGLRIIRLK